MAISHAVSIFLLAMLGGPKAFARNGVGFQWPHRLPSGADQTTRRAAAKPFADANRARTVALDFIDKLTNAELVEKAEQMERQGSAALAAVR
jgi:hypothetical protein